MNNKMFIYKIQGPELMKMFNMYFSYSYIYI